MKFCLLVEDRWKNVSAKFHNCSFSGFFLTALESWKKAKIDSSRPGLRYRQIGKHESFEVKTNHLKLKI